MYYRLCRNEDKDNDNEEEGEGEEEEIEEEEEEITEKRSGDGMHRVPVLLRGTTGMHIYAVVQVYG
jgi:hypothetical protein